MQGQYKREGVSYRDTHNAESKNDKLEAIIEGNKRGNQQKKKHSRMEENLNNFVNLGAQGTGVDRKKKENDGVTFAMQCSKKQTHNIGYKIDKVEATIEAN